MELLWLTDMAHKLHEEILCVQSVIKWKYVKQEEISIGNLMDSFPKCFTIRSGCHLLWIQNATAQIKSNKKEKEIKITVKNKQQQFINIGDRSKKSFAKILLFGN